MLKVLETRFRENMKRHPELTGEELEQRLRGNETALTALRRMEDSGGEPDAVVFPAGSGCVVFCDCAKETPSGRRSLCYDDEALAKRAKNPPAGSALRQAQDMGIALMTEALSRRLQELGELDCKTSGWIATPEEIRRQGGALFCERRYRRPTTTQPRAI